MNIVDGKVSVVIPTYNRADVVLTAVESVLAQTYEHLELCIVDDGSSDNTSEVLAQITDPRVRVITHEVNRGACAALNTGIESTDGQFIAFLDTDDVWLPRKLAKQVSRMQEDPSENAVAVGCGWELMDGRPGRVPGRGVASYHDVLKGPPGSGGPTLLVRRLESQPLWNLELPSMQDRVFVIEYAKQGSVVFVPEVLLRVGRGRSDHITKPRSTMLAYERILDMFEPEFEEWPDLRSHYLIRAAREALIIRELSRGTSHFKLALREGNVSIGERLEFLLGLLFGYKGLAAYTRLRGRHGYS